MMIDDSSVGYLDLTFVGIYLYVFV